MATDPPRPSRWERAGSFSVRNRRRVVAAWLAGVVLCVALGLATGTEEMSDADGLAGSSARAAAVLDATPFPPTVDLEVRLASRAGTVDDPAVLAAADDLARAAAAEPGLEVAQPAGPDAPSAIAADRRAVLVLARIRLDRVASEEDLRQRIDGALQATRTAHPDVDVQAFSWALADEPGAFADDDASLRRAEMLAIPVTLTVMLLAFGSVVAAALPVLLGLLAVLAALGLLGPLSHLVPTEDSTITVVLLLGLAVGVDYSLFYLRREREERARGRDGATALAIAAATSGRAIVISGLTVMIALSGLFLAGIGVFDAIALGTILVVGVSVLGSITLLPALLAIAGPRVESLRIPFLHRPTDPDRASGAWAWLLVRVLRRPWPVAIAATALLVLLAVPALRLSTEQFEADDLRATSSLGQARAAIERDFPGETEPARVVVRVPPGGGAAVEAALPAFRERALATGAAHDPVRVERSLDGEVLVVEVPLTGGMAGDDAARSLALLREQVIPPTLGSVPGARVDVGGHVADVDDFNAALASRMPLVVGFVLVLAFVLLLLAFRSLVVPATAIMLNLLSVGAAYGLLVLVFQDGHGAELLGAPEHSPIVAWLPMFLFVVLFGLSMDYHLFILTRIKELRDGGRTTPRAVSEGIQATASTVTTAAVVMVAVFAIFATLDQLELKQAGVGLAAAILVDATIIRALLLPAVMRLLGEANWYLPRWLGWLPTLESDGRAGTPQADPPDLGSRDERTDPAGAP